MVGFANHVETLALDLSTRGSHQLGQECCDEM